jgi:hypothetical protein
LKAPLTFVLASGQLLGQTDSSPLGPSPTALSPPPKVRICVIVAGNAPDRSWCLSEAEVTSITQRLAKAEKNLGNVEFVMGRAASAAETTELLRKAGPDAPVLGVSADIFGLSRVMPTVFKEGRPAAVFHLPVIGGHDWCLVKPWRDEGNRITLFNISRQCRRRRYVQECVSPFPLFCATQDGWSGWPGGAVSVAAARRGSGQKRWDVHGFSTPPCACGRTAPTPALRTARCFAAGAFGCDCGRNWTPSLPTPTA